MHEAAVRLSERGEHTYSDLIRKTMLAECIGYFVKIAGRHALYFGCNGETHLELFRRSEQQVQAATSV